MFEKDGLCVGPIKEKKESGEIQLQQGQAAERTICSENKNKTITSHKTQRTTVTMQRLYRGSKIVAIAKNYAKHKVEMGGTPERLEKPCFFLKPNSSIVYEPSPIVRPAAVKDLHYEVELGVEISKVTRNITPDQWR